MQKQPQEPKGTKRKLLTLLTTSMGIAGLVAYCVPFKRSLNISKYNNDRFSNDIFSPKTVSIKEMKPGDIKSIEWGTRGIFIYKRTIEDIESMSHIDVAQLVDPDSVENHQPEYAQNSMRSIRPDIFIVESQCTHLGCSTNHVKGERINRDPELSSAFFCPCHGSVYDNAGRVFKNLPAPSNMVVPQHKFLDKETVVIGFDRQIR